jgi:cell division inhibitor SepF
MYLGLVEDDEYEVYDDYEDLAEPEPQVQHRRSSLRRVEEPRSRRSRKGGGGDWDGDAVVRPLPDARPKASVYWLNPTNYGAHAQELGDRFRAGSIVFLNLQQAQEPTKGRLKNFASGLVYGLEGKWQEVGQDIFLLTPKGVDVSGEEQRKLLEEQGLFYQA